MGKTAPPLTITYHPYSEDLKAIMDEQARLAYQGLRVSRSHCIRSLILRGAASIQEHQNEMKDHNS